MVFCGVSLSVCCVLVRDFGYVAGCSAIVTDVSSPCATASFREILTGNDHDCVCLSMGPLYALETGGSNEQVICFFAFPYFYLSLNESVFYLAFDLLHFPLKNLFGFSSHPVTALC